MKKTTIMLAGLVILLGISGTLLAQPLQQKERPREKLSNALQIRQEMREIEKNVIDNDSELQSIVENIKAQHQKLRERLDSKLSNNTEYQKLKKQLDEMREEWKEMGPGPGGHVGPREGTKNQTK